MAMAMDRVRWSGVGAAGLLVAISLGQAQDPGRTVERRHLHDPRRGPGRAARPGTAIAVDATVRTLDDDRVSITVLIDGEEAISAVDDLSGVGGRTLTGMGAIGVRCDNTESCLVPEPSPHASIVVPVAPDPRSPRTGRGAGTRRSS